MRKWINMIESVQAMRETLWVNAKTGEVIDVAEEGAAHHAEYLIDNPERLGIRMSGRAYQNALNMEYEDLVSDSSIRQEAFKKNWVRVNCSADGWVNAEAMSEDAILNACWHLLEQGFQINSLMMEFGSRYHNLSGADLNEFLGR